MKTYPKLPDVPFGIEIEFLVPRRKGTDAVLQLLSEAGFVTTGEDYYDHWTASYDGGTNDAVDYQAVELRSHILRGEDGLAEVRQVMDLLSKAWRGQNRAGAFCGMHIHISREGLDLKQTKRWFALHTRYERCIDQLVAIRRRPPYSYACGGITPNMRKKGGVKRILDGGETRTGSFNVRGYPTTVELRQHQGSIDGERAANWIALQLYIRERAIGDVGFGSNLIDGASDASFRFFLQDTGAPKNVRDYWMAERARLAAGGDENLPPLDLKFARNQFITEQNKKATRQPVAA